MENFQGILERVVIALKDCGPDLELQGHNLSLTAKEKLPEDDVQASKHWLIDLQDSFESLIEWAEIWVQIMEKMSGFRKRKFDGPLPEGGKSQEAVSLTHVNRTIHHL